MCPAGRTRPVTARRVVRPQPRPLLPRWSSAAPRKPGRSRWSPGTSRRSPPRAGSARRDRPIWSGLW